MTIKRLPDEMIARIAAGEVITRPYNILKETIENSLDASCTRITIRIGSDVLSLEVGDDGEGIAEEDFELLCKPHCTSKLTEEADLFSLSSYGFRGEALSSMSRCSKIKARSKKKENEMGFEAHYNDSQLVSIRGVGMKDGTSIEIRDIFYNNKVREKYFFKRREEIREMLELVEAYAVLNCTVSFEVSVGGEMKRLFGNMKKTGNEGVLEKIKMLDYVYKTNQELLHVEEEFLVIFTSQNFSLKKGVFLLFVNRRLVTNHTMKEAFFRIYKDVLPPTTYPLVYLELRTNESETDVNVHPCKKEVLFANEETITRKVCRYIENRLNMHHHEKKALRISSRGEEHNLPKVYSDPTSQSIVECLEEKEVVTRDFRLRSLTRLRSKTVEVDSEFFRLLTYVGVKDKDTILVQHNSSLLNCKVKCLLREYFYQAILHSFGNFDRKDCLIRTEIPERLSGMLDDYFSIRLVGNEIVTLPIVSTVCVEDEELWSSFSIKSCSEYEALEETVGKIAEIYSNAEISPRLFNVVKRKIAGTEAALKCFGLVVTLKELYRNFERC